MKWYRNISQVMDHIDQKSSDEGKDLKGPLPGGWVRFERVETMRQGSPEEKSRSTELRKRCLDREWFSSRKKQ